MNKLSSYKTNAISKTRLKINSQIEIEEVEKFKDLINQQISNASLITNHIENISSQNLMISKEIQEVYLNSFYILAE